MNDYLLGTTASQPKQAGWTMADFIETMEKVKQTPCPMPTNVIISPWAYKIITVWRGIPSAQKPNSRRPLYRKAKKTVYLSYLVRGIGLICHPAIADQIKKRYEKAD